MSVCPNCHQMDKNFFAPQCHNCNEKIGFMEQCVHSLIWTVVPFITVAVAIAVIWFFITIFG